MYNSLSWVNHTIQDYNCEERFTTLCFLFREQEETSEETHKNEAAEQRQRELQRRREEERRKREAVSGCFQYLRNGSWFGMLHWVMDAHTKLGAFSPNFPLLERIKEERWAEIIGYTVVYR